MAKSSPRARASDMSHHSVEVLLRQVALGGGGPLCHAARFDVDESNLKTKGPRVRTHADDAPHHHIHPRPWRRTWRFTSTSARLAEPGRKVAAVITSGRRHVHACWVE